jgi:hypothetical protein
MRQTTLKAIEVVHVCKELADNQHRPAIGKDLRRTGDRAVLAVKVHGPN